MKDFNIEEEYQKYLSLSQLSELKMHPIQRMETRRAFIAGYGMCFRQFEIVGKIDEASAYKRLAMIEKQVASFFNNQAVIKPKPSNHA